MDTVLPFPDASSEPSETDETTNRDNRACWMFTDAQFAPKLCHLSSAAPDELEI